MTTQTLCLLAGACAALGFAGGYLRTDSKPRRNDGGAPPPAQRSASPEHQEIDVASSDESHWQEEVRNQIFATGRLPSRVQRVAEVTELFASLSLPELQLAARSLPQRPEAWRHDVALALAFRMLEIDASAAAQMIAQVSDANGLIAVSFLQEWQRQDAPAALAWVVQLPGKVEPKLLQWRTAGALKQWAKEDPAAAAKFAVSSVGALGGGGVEAVFSTWAEKSAADAMASAFALDNVRLRRSAMQAIVQAWTAKDAPAALAWINRLEDPRLRTELTASFAKGLAATDRERSIELLRALPEGRHRSGALVWMAESMRWQDLSESLRLMEEVPLEQSNDALKSYYFGMMHDDAPAAMASLLKRHDRAADAAEAAAIESLLKGAVQTGLMRNAPALAEAIAEQAKAHPSAVVVDLSLRTAVGWAQRDLAEARRWTESLPSGPAREGACKGLLRSWAWSAPSDAAAWIDEQPASPSRDAATSGFVIAALSRDPQSSIARLRTIRDAAAQQAALQEGWRYWKMRDATAAEKWRTTSPDLSAKERESLSTGAP